MTAENAENTGESTAEDTENAENVEESTAENADGFVKRKSRAAKPGGGRRHRAPGTTHQARSTTPCALRPARSFG